MLRKRTAAEQKKVGQKKTKRMNPYKRLTKSEVKRIVGMVKKALPQGKKFQSAQETIPYLAMYRDGTCQVTGKLFTRTIEFADINYLLARDEDKDAIFENWCNFINSYESSVYVQFTYVNREISKSEANSIIDIPERDDQYNELRREYSGIIKMQYQKGNNGLKRSKYITYGIEADSIASARKKLMNLELEVLNNLKAVGCTAFPLDGFARLDLLHDLINPGTGRKLNFNWNLVAETGLTTKNFIAPPSFEFREKEHFPIGKKIASTSFMQIMAPEFSDKILSDFLKMDSNLIISIHLQTVPQQKAIKNIQNVMSNIDRMKIEEQMRANRQGYDMDILPPELKASAKEAETMLNDLQSRNEHMIMATILLTVYGATKEEHDVNFFAAQSIAEKHTCRLQNLEWQQEDGFMSCIPIGANKINIKRGLTTSSVGIFMPFMTQELCQRVGTYYGVNAQSNNIIIADRKKLSTPNGLILGKPGSGKSFSSKREIVDTGVRLMDDDVLIVDPEREYSPLVEALGGQVIRISADSSQHINPMDMFIPVSNEEDKDYNPLTTKSNFILSLCEQAMGGKVGLSPYEIALIDRCVKNIYQPYLKNPQPGNVPLLQDLYEALRSQPEQEASYLATSLELYVTGSLNVFNHRTNVDMENRLVCFDIKDLESQLKKLGLLIMQNQVWNRVTINRDYGKTTWYYIDEFHLLLQEDQTATASVEIWKRFRKWGGIPTGITQNIKDFLGSPQIQNIFDNSDFVYLLDQSPGDQYILAKQLNISDYQLSYITNAPQGSGLLKYGSTMIPFIDQFPRDTKLYQLMTTKPDEVARMKREKTKTVSSVPQGD